MFYSTTFSFIKLKEATSLLPYASSGVERASWTHCLMYTAHGELSYVVQIGAKTLADICVALSDAFMLRCNAIKNRFTKITGIQRCFPRLYLSVQ